MANVHHLSAFVRTAEHGSFSAAARVLGLTPAGVSRNVARLELDLGIRLFHRTTRHLSLTKEGERFLRQVDGPLAALREAVDSACQAAGEPAGILKLSMGQSFGRAFVLPLLGEFLSRHPRVLPDLHFDNDQVDIVGEGFDAAIGGGFRLADGLVSRALAPIHIVAVASPAYMAGRTLPRTPAELEAFDGIMRRSTPSGRVRPWTLRSRRAAEQTVQGRQRLVLSDPGAVAQAARMGLGVALLPMLFVHEAIRSGELLRLLPGWYDDVGSVSIYYPSRRMVPARTTAFAEFVVEQFRSARLAELVDGR